MSNKIKKVWRKIFGAYNAFINNYYPAFWFKEYLSGYERELREVERVIGRRPSLHKPKSINDKILWKKLNNRNKLLVKTSDKIKVRDYVKKKLGHKADEILIPFLFISVDPRLISFQELRPPYVIKANHASGSNIFVYEEKDENRYLVSTPKEGKSVRKEEFIIDKCKQFLEYTYGLHRHEWAYTKVKRMILVEEFVPDAYGSLLTDVKFDCFHGVPKYILVKVNSDECSLHSLLDARGQRLNVEYNGPGEVPDKVLKDMRPLLPELRHYASRLSEDFDYCRVDFYLTPKGPLFGEITHYPASGARRMKPQSFALEIGRHWKLRSG